MRLQVERYAGACSAVYLVVDDTGKRSSDLVLVANVSYMGMSVELVPWVGRTAEDCTITGIQKAVKFAVDAGMWQQSDHSKNKRYFEIDSAAPDIVVFDV